MELQKEYSASFGNLDTSPPLHLPGEALKKLRSQRGVELAVRWLQVPPRLRYRGAGLSPSSRLASTSPAGAGSETRGSWVTGRTAPLRLGVREPVEATQLAPPPQLSLVPHSP